MYVKLIVSEYEDGEVTSVRFSSHPSDNGTNSTNFSVIEKAGRADTFWVNGRAVTREVFFDRLGDYRSGLDQRQRELLEPLYVYV